MQTRNILKLITAIIICQLAGIIGQFWVTPNLTWYDTLQKPAYAPPGTIIGIVWVTLFTLMGISLYLVWQKGLNTPYIKPAFTAFATQLTLNTSWNYFFFALQSPFYGLIVILIMWIAIATTILLFYKIHKTAATLLLPYLVWVTIATILNYTIHTLNP
jgi:benzodiazapine receptor